MPIRVDGAIRRDVDAVGAAAARRVVHLHLAAARIQPPVVTALPGKPVDALAVEYRGIQVGVIANNRGMIRPAGGGPPRFGGIIYTESAEKVAYFIETCNRRGTPLLFIQDVSGFMVGPEAAIS